jgi:hypothetical protein
MMAAPRFVARAIVVAVACAVATVWLGWQSVPVIGFIYGVVDRRTPAPGILAALGATLGWVAILAALAARGANIGGVAERMGAVMQIPAGAFVVGALAFAAVLGGTAAVVGAAMSHSKVTRR